MDDASSPPGHTRPPTLGSQPPTVPLSGATTLVEPPVPQAAPEAPSGKSTGDGVIGRDRRLYLALALAVLAVLAAGWAAYEARQNGRAADAWHQRAIEYEEQVNGLRTLIGERSAQLNNRTRQANALASNLRSTRSQLRRSEGDVTSLSQRQRELANEKAHLEDERRSLQQQAGMLTDIASRYIDCKSSLIDVINALIDENYSDASYEISLARSYCDGASSALNAYVNAYS